MPSSQQRLSERVAVLRNYVTVNWKLLKYGVRRLGGKKEKLPNGRQGNLR